MKPLAPLAFERLVADALDALPAPLGELMENVAVVVEDEHPTEDLLGLWGVPLTERGTWRAGDRRHTCTGCRCVLRGRADRKR